MYKILLAPFQFLKLYYRMPVFVLVVSAFFQQLSDFTLSILDHGTICNNCMSEPAQIHIEILGIFKNSLSPLCGGETHSMIHNNHYIKFSPICDCPPTSCFISLGSSYYSLAYLFFLMFESDSISLHEIYFAT